MSDTSHLVDKTWDPITRIVGSLGIHARIDFRDRTVVRCHSTSSIFRGYSVFMKGKDPRDAHQITSRICGICGDNHATASVYAQQMAYGIKPPHLAEWIVNLAEAAEYMFDHNLYQENLVGVDFCARMVGETNPAVLARAEVTEAPHAADHGYRTIADIMRAFNPMEGALYLEALKMSRLTREMFCLMEGRHVHPSLLYPGGVGTVPTVQLFDDYLVRLVRYVEHLKRIVPLHDDLFDFMYEALPGYEEVGRRRILLGSWGSFQDPETCDFRYDHMSAWGRDMFVTPGIVVDGELITTDLVEINLGMRILLGSSFYDDWAEGETFVTHDPLGNPVDQRHPWNQTTSPRPQRRNLEPGGHYTWVMSPRWLDSRTGEHLALDTGGGPLARLWVTALAGRVHTPYVDAPGDGSVRIRLPRTAHLPETEFEWRVPQWSNTIERDRARTYFQAYSAAMAFHFLEQAMAEVERGPARRVDPLRGARRSGVVRVPRGGAGRALPPHGHPPGPHRQLPPVPAHLLERQPPGLLRHRRPLRGRGAGVARSSRRTAPTASRASTSCATIRSFDPCLPCGVHMYLGGGKVRQAHHGPTLGVR